MDLTGRQREFLSSFLNMYRASSGPLHYSDVAAHMGISKITAYDMLKLLEERGLVRAEYLLPERGQRPGRSTIVFHPTPEARALFTELAGDDWGDNEWAEVKTRIFESLRSEDYADYQALLVELVERIPESSTPMQYAAGMVTAVLLALHEVKGEATGSLQETLRRLGVPGERRLSALAGVSLGLSCVEQANRHLTQLLVSYTERYQTILSRLSPKNLRRLSDFAQDVACQIELARQPKTKP